MSHPPHNIDDIIESYDIADNTIFAKRWNDISARMWHDISHYDDDGAQYGAKQLSPHLERISKDGANFLTYLGYKAHVARNFENAYRLSDIGKIDKRYDPAIWSLPHRPTEEERILKRKHTNWSLDVIATYLDNAEEHILEHAHVKDVIPALSLYHHERIDGKGPLGLQTGKMGVIIQVACIVDAYDGDRIKRPHQPAQRTPEETLNRMGETGDSSKYKGAFDVDLLTKYRHFKLEIEG